jgi:hypothetical protein
LSPARGGDRDNLHQVLTALQRRTTALAPGSVVGTGIYLHTGQVRLALLTCVLGPPAVVAGKVLADWVRLLAPPRRWRRPRRKGG